MRISLTNYNIEGLQIQVAHGGKGRPLLMLPGVTGNCDLWDPVMPYLVDNFEIYSCSFPQYNSLNKNGLRYTISTLQYFLEKLYQTFRLTKADILAHSLGGIVALQYSISKPAAIGKLILTSCPLKANSIPTPTAWKVGIRILLSNPKLLNFLDKKLKNRAVRQNLSLFNTALTLPRNFSKLYDNFLKHIPISALFQCYHDLFQFDAEAIAAKADKVPVLFLYGKKDPWLKQFHGTSLYKKMSKAQTLEIDCEHFIPRTNPGDVAMAVRNFLSN